MNLKERSYQAELLDQENIPKADLFQNLKELNTINTLLGGHSVTIKGLQSLIKNSKKTITIADIGCGGGDNLRQMAIWLRKQNIKAQLTGIDLKEDCIEYARNQCKAFPEISFIHSDYRNVSQHFDIITSALFCHHLDDEQLNHYLKWSAQNSRIGFFINDLHRHFLAFYSIKWLTFLFSNSYLVKNDAPLSVNRGFKGVELKSYISIAGIKEISIRWVWAFRFLIVYKHAQ